MHDIIILLIIEVHKMNCFFCGSEESKVIDSRDTNNGQSIRRRRECLNCGKRYTTYETIEVVPLLIIKSDHSRQAFDINKLKRSIMLACEKRPISLDTVNEIASDIERSIYNASNQEIDSSTLGEMVLRKLRRVDEIAFIKYALIFKKFKNLNDFMDYLRYQ